MEPQADCLHTVLTTNDGIQYEQYFAVKGGMSRIASGTGTICFVLLNWERSCISRRCFPPRAKQMQILCKYALTHVWSSLHIETQNPRTHTTECVCMCACKDEPLGTNMCRCMVTFSFKEIDSYCRLHFLAVREEDLGQWASSRKRHRVYRQKMVNVRWGPVGVGIWYLHCVWLSTYMQHAGL